MPIDDPLVEHLADLAHPVVDIDFGTAQTQRRFTAHRDAMGAFSTIQTSVVDIAHLWGMTGSEHLVHQSIIVASIVPRIDAFKSVPMLDKDLFEDIPGQRGFCRHQAVPLRGIVCDSAVLPHPAHHIHPTVGLYWGMLPHLAHP